MPQSIRQAARKGLEPQKEAQNQTTLCGFRVKSRQWASQGPDAVVGNSNTNVYPELTVGHVPILVSTLEHIS